MTTISRLLLVSFVLVASVFCAARGQEFLTNGLVAYYPFSGNADDASANGNNAISHGAQLATDRFGVVANSYSFADGAYISTTKSVGFPTSTHDFTVSVWVSFSAIPSEPQMIFVNKDINQFQFELQPTSASRAYLFFWTGGLHSGAADCRTAISTWTLNRWYNLVVVRSDNVVTIYQDRTIVGQSQTLHGNAASTANQNLDFGYRSSPGGYACCPLFGQLDDIRVYNRALSASEVEQLYLIEAPPQMNVKKAVYVDSTTLKVGTNYQLQVSSDLKTWTNHGSPFISTNANWRSVDYWDVDNWTELYFRLQNVP